VQDLQQALAETASAVDAVMEAAIPNGGGPESRLFEAMRYSGFAGGKRLRPFFVAAGASLFDVPQARALRAGAAVEFIHCYSLIHDDLPAMDDAELRRGRPTVHKAFDDATAVLAGDAFQALAFAVLSDPATHPDAAVRCALVATLAEAAGAKGMCGGQMFDLLAETMALDLEAITRLQGMKTGALFSFSCEAGAILGEAPEAAREALRAYAADMGLAFQIADDLLDAEGTEEQVGKSVGRDAEAGKATFVSLLGLENARKEAYRLAQRAAQHLDFFDGKARLLQTAARFVVDRRA
jgi:farnesyl diphosphate synthase